MIASCGIISPNHSEPTMAAVRTEKSVIRRPRCPSFRNPQSAPAATIPRTAPRDSVSAICQSVTPTTTAESSSRRGLRRIDRTTVRTANGAVTASSAAFQLMFCAIPKRCQPSP